MICEKENKVAKPHIFGLEILLALCFVQDIEGNDSGKITNLTLQQFEWINIFNPIFLPGDCRQINTLATLFDD